MEELKIKNEKNFAVCFLHRTFADAFQLARWGKREGRIFKGVFTYFIFQG
ncbi:MAG: hypothetical protein K2I11_03185 [Bacteroides sp.]|nr:hypothetical protein [Bacteroides sp.]